MTVSSLAGMGQRGEGKASLRGKGKKVWKGREETAKKNLGFPVVVS